MKKLIKAVVVFAVFFTLYYAYKKHNNSETVKTETIDSSAVAVDTSKYVVAVDSVSNKTIVK